MVFDTSLVQLHNHVYLLYPLKEKALCAVMLEGWKTQSALVGSKANDWQSHKPTLMLEKNPHLYIGSVKSA